jgi:NTP pyrophosphatase (non-canonical NTP hydrolase)
MIEPMPATLAGFADVALRNIRTHFPAEGERERQVFALIEEVGEVVGAYRRWAGLARRTGSFEDMANELADVVITSYVTAAVFGIDLDGARAALRPKASLQAPREVLRLYVMAADFVAVYEAAESREDVHLRSAIQLALVVNSAFRAADAIGIDLDVAWRRKGAEILARPWRDPRTSR